MYTYRPEESAAANPLGGVRTVIPTDQAFANVTGGTAAAITGFSVTVLKAQCWLIELQLITVGVSGGGKVSISGPATPSLLTMTVRGLTSGITAYSTDTVTALDTLSAAYNTSAVTGEINVRAVIVPSADGTVTFNAANVTNSNSFTINKGSTLVATRIF